MLTGDLARFRIQGDQIKPSYITRRHSGRYIPLGGALIKLFRSNVGKPRIEIDEALLELEEGRIDYKVARGLAKLLDEACEFRPITEMNYAAFRARVFSLAQSHYPIVSKPDLMHPKTRDDVLAAIAAETGVSPPEMETFLYGDLPENLILSSFKPDVTPESLLRRYNLALAQAVLYHAVEMRIRITGDYRVVFQYLRLSRLMHDIRKVPEGYDVRINGPASIFSNTQRYGVRMAMFLPGLILADGWSMRADVRTPEGTKLFLLNSNSGLTSHYKPTPPFDSRVEETFFNKFANKDRGWTIEREGDIVVLDDSVFIPDFTFRREDGKTVHFEIVGYWTPEYLAKKMSKIRKAGPELLIVAVNRSLNCGREDFKGEWIDYTTGIKIKTVLERLERIGDSKNSAN
jgi:predicted nuclease of restriction endonuclease-like RecB superfamily